MGERHTMKRQIRSFAVVAAFLALTAFTAARAEPPTLVPITADQAFDAVAMQVDPVSGTGAPVYLIDVRDPYEVYMNGGPAAVEEIRLWGDAEGGGTKPDYGKVRLVQEGKFVEYHVNGRYRRERVRDVEGMAAMSLVPDCGNTRTPLGLCGQWFALIGPAIRSGHGGVEVIHEPLDLGGKVLERGEVAAANDLTGQDAKPDLDLIEP